MMLRYRQALPVIPRQIRIESYCQITPSIVPAKVPACVILRSSSSRKERPLDIRLTTIAPPYSSVRTMAAEDVV
jgi:hypothetical protein